VRDQVVGTNYSLHRGGDTTPPRQPWGCTIPLCETWGEMTVQINLYELTAPFECCILEMEWMETWGNSLRFWNRKCIKWIKKLFFLSNLLLLRREIFLRGDVVKGQHVMLIKWENFGAFLSWLLRREIFLTGDFLNKFYCIFFEKSCIF
jgi:hypothetical protein